MATIRRPGLTFAAGLVAVAGALVWVAPAGAAVSCAYDQNADVLTISADANNDTALFGVDSGGEIVVIDGVANASRTCTGLGGPPTVANTTTVNLTDTRAGVVEKFKLRLERRQLRAIAASRRAGEKPKVTVSASAVDLAGNVSRDRMVVRAKG